MKKNRSPQPQGCLWRVAVLVFAALLVVAVYGSDPRFNLFPGTRTVVLTVAGIFIAVGLFIGFVLYPTRCLECRGWLCFWEAGRRVVGSRGVKKYGKRLRTVEGEKGYQYWEDYEYTVTESTVEVTRRCKRCGHTTTERNVHESRSED